MLLLLSVVPFFPSCTGEAPVVDSVRYYTIASYNPQSGERNEALSIFLNVSHEDGEQQLSEWRVSHEESQLHWEQHANSWEQRVWDERSWIGSSSLRAPDREELPRGRYSVKVVDRGGRESVTQFELRTLDFTLADATFPRMIPAESSEHEGERWTVEHGGDRLVATVISQQGEVLWRQEPDDGVLRLDDLEISEDGDSVAEQDSAAAVYLHELRERSEVWLVSGPWAL